MTHPNPRLQWEAFHNLDFLLTVEWMWTPLAEIADLVLPTTHWMEETAVDVVVIPSNRCLSVRQAVVEPRGEAKDTGQMHCEILQRMIEKGYLKEEDVRRYFPWKSAREFVDWSIANTGLTYEQFLEKKDGIIFSPPSNTGYTRRRGLRPPRGRWSFTPASLRSSDTTPCQIMKLEGSDVPVYKGRA